MKWIENDELFKKELLSGYGWQQYVADYLKSLNFDVHVPELKIKKSIAEISKFQDEPDIEWCGKIFEVKSRKISFTCPEDFPYNTILVDTVAGWEVKKRKPDEYICISTVTKEMIALSGATQPLWEKATRYDHTRKIEATFYIAHKDLWVPIWVLTGQMEVYLSGVQSV